MCVSAACSPALCSDSSASWPGLHCSTTFHRRCWYFEPVEPAEPVERWSIGTYRFRLLVAGRLPIGEHVINVQRTVADPEEVGTSPVVWHDAGYSDLIRVWDHQIVLEDFLGMTRYTDHVEIHAGLLTVPAWLFAQVFYLHRQRRLNRLVAAGFAY